MVPLIRKFNRKSREKLSESSLFKNCLKPDCTDAVNGRKRVFPAIRDGNIDFYYRGGRLFKFDGNNFKTNTKHASVIAGGYSGDIVESKLKDLKLISSFEEGYERVKENCSKYAGKEAIGAAELQSAHSYLIPENRIVVLDIEIQFAKNNSRIDLLVYNMDERCLRFYELKHYKNSELWSKEGTKPKVTEQIEKYNEIISDAGTKDLILDAYKSYIDIVNELFEVNLAYPDKIDDRAALLWFGFDNNQKKKAQKLLFDDNSLQNINHYAIGDTKNCDMKNLWFGTK